MLTSSQPHWPDPSCPSVGRYVGWGISGLGGWPDLDGPMGSSSLLSQNSEEWKGPAGNQDPWSSISKPGASEVTRGPPAPSQPAGGGRPCSPPGRWQAALGHGAADAVAVNPHGHVDHRGHVGLPGWVCRSGSWGKQGVRDSAGAGHPTAQGPALCAAPGASPVGHGVQHGPPPGLTTQRPAWLSVVQSCILKNPRLGAPRHCRSCPPAIPPEHLCLQTWWPAGTLSTPSP